MKTHFKQIVPFLFVILFMGCSSDEVASDLITVTPPVVTPPVTTVPTTPIATSINYLALGDSYTIGQSVCETCRYPEQLKTSLSMAFPSSTFSVKVIARTGWTTSNLIGAINGQTLESNYDLVTLLIGVNNQFQHMDFSLYQKEFPELLTKAIALAKGDYKNVIVLSIPDYAYTPYAMMYGESGKAMISADIDKYNKFAEDYCKTKSVTYISITDITRQGLSNTSLVASDGLHPSESAYKLFVDRMLPKAKMILQD